MESVRAYNKGKQEGRKFEQRRKNKERQIKDRDIKAKKSLWEGQSKLNEF